MHLNLAHKYWEEFLTSDDVVIDATCGNGRDAAFLAPKCKRLICMDIQEVALIKCKDICPFDNVEFVNQSHEVLPDVKARLVVYNLGYLPGGDKNITTKVASTVMSIQSAVMMAEMVSVMCYPGHLEGEKEERAVLELAQGLPREFEVVHHRWVNRAKFPSLLIIKKLF